MNKSIDIEKLRYPIGKFHFPEKIEPFEINKWISDIESLPAQLVDLLKDVTDVELSWIYRPEGWNIRQVVHHLADSHMNSLTRFKWTLTEDTPTIKPYFEARWALLPDTLETPITDSLKILEGVHSRLTVLLKSLTEDDLKKEFVHPEYDRKISLSANIALYAWHSKHHLAHIEQALRFKGRFSE